MMNLRNKIIIISIMATFLIGVAGLWAYQNNVYSKEIIKFEILGPDKAEAGQEIEYTVKYKNNGTIRVEEPRIVFEYPENAITESGSLREEISSDQLDDDGAIYPGEEKVLHFKARLIGKEKDQQTAKATLWFRPKNLESFYDRSASFTTEIEKVPLTFEFDFPSKIEPDKEIKFQLNYFSYVDYPLSNLEIEINYPDGFEFKSSSPSALEKTRWPINLLRKSEGGRVEINGKLSGNPGENKTFEAKLNLWQEGKPILLKETSQIVEIIEPSIYISQKINGNPQYIANTGDLLHYEISFRNIGEKSLTDLSLVAKLEGNLFDFGTIKTINGNFGPGDNSIIFDGGKVPELRFLESLQEGKVEFWINLKKDWQMESLADKNLTIKSKIYIGQQAREEFVTKVNSKLVIDQKGYFRNEVLSNSGPIPPQVNKATSYVIIWYVRNYYNDVKNVRVKAVLPSGVNLTSQIFPEEQRQKFSFDPISREIVWNLGDLEAIRENSLVFQISFVPNLSQKGQVPEIIREATVFAEDSWTEELLQSKDGAINTTLPDDDTVSEQQGIVQ